MKLTGTWLFAMLLAGATPAALQLAPGDKPANIFGGKKSNVSVMFLNFTDQDFSAEIRTRIYQTSSATAVLVSEAVWKSLRVLPQQTVLESARLDFPVVKVETKFLVQWLENSNRVIGTTEVWVYPTNLLAELKSLLGEAAFGVLDPNNELKPLLKQNGVMFVDLRETALEDFTGKLAVVGPFRSKVQLPEDMAKRTKAMATNGVAVVWIQPSPGPRDPWRPSYFSVFAATNAIVIVQSGLLAGLAENPQAQQQLVQLCRQALHPEPTPLP